MDSPRPQNDPIPAPDTPRGRLGGGIGMRIEHHPDAGESLEAVVREFRDGQPERQIIANISASQAVHCDIGRVQQVAGHLRRTRFVARFPLDARTGANAPT